MFSANSSSGFYDTAEIYSVLLSEGEDVAKQWLTDRGLNDRDVEVVIEALYLSNFSSQPPINED